MKELEEMVDSWSRVRNRQGKPTISCHSRNQGSYQRLLGHVKTVQEPACLNSCGTKLGNWDGLHIRKNNWNEFKQGLTHGFIIKQTALSTIPLPNSWNTFVRDEARVLFVCFFKKQVNKGK